ncbi:MAG: hypothetical protein QW751_01080 [Candidatus Aenigmatarchaeota archaeon]
MIAVDKLFIAFCRLTGRWLAAPASKELQRAVRLLKWDLKPEYIVGAAKFAMIVIAVVLSTLTVLAFIFNTNPLMFAVTIPLSILIFYVISEWPKNLARDKAVAALGWAPQVVAAIAIPLKQNPNLEAALAFAAEYGEGELIEDFRKLVWAGWTGKVSNLHKGILLIAKKWGHFSQGFSRGLHMIAASFHEIDLRRKAAALDGAVSVVLEDVVSRMREYAQGLHIPTLLLFSLGTILPLMVVSLFPLVAFFGMDVPPAAIAAFLALSVIASYVYSNNILRTRPPTFSQPVVRSDVPEGYMIFGKRTVQVAPLAACAALLISAPGIFYLLSEVGIVPVGPLGFVAGIGTIIVLWGIAIGTAIYFWGTVRHKVAARQRIKAAEEQFVDSLYHIRNRLSDGRPVEDAIEFAGRMSGGPEAAAILSDISGRMRRLSLPLETAIEQADVQSNLIMSILRLLTVSLKKGVAAAAQTATLAFNYINKIRKVERGLIMMLNKNLSMMRATAMFFAPVVCAMIVVMFQLITATVANTQHRFTETGYSGFAAGMLGTPSVSPEVLQLIVGLYALGLTAVLVRFVSRIALGPDRIGLRMDLAKALPATMIMFTITLLIARTLLLSGGVT